MPKLIENMILQSNSLNSKQFKSSLMIQANQLLIIIMNRQYKVIVFHKINVEFDQQEVADQYQNRRLKWRIKKFGITDVFCQCKFEANFKDKKLDWDEKVELIFDNFQKYEIQVMECVDKDDQIPITILKGIVYLYPSKQFSQNSCHLFTLQGQKLGLIRLRIKLGTKIQETIKIKDSQRQKFQLIPQNLLGIMRVYEVKARMFSYSLNKAKSNKLSLTLKFEGKEWNSQCQQGNMFTFDSNISDQIINGEEPMNLEQIFPFEGITLSHITDNPLACLRFEISDEDQLILKGSLPCQYLSQMRRYPTQTVSLLNQKGVKVADLCVQMRYITKQQLIGLIYSPKNNPDFNKRSTSKAQVNSTKFTSIGKATSLIKPHSFGEISMKKHYKLAQSLRYPNRSYSKTSQIPKKPINNNISYIDPQKWSDFSIKKHRGWDMSLGRKSDFTRSFKGNPGVGSYQLPSLFRHK